MLNRSLVGRMIKVIGGIFEHQRPFQAHIAVLIIASGFFSAGVSQKILIIALVNAVQPGTVSDEVSLGALMERQQ